MYEKEIRTEISGYYDYIGHNIWILTQLLKQCLETMSAIHKHQNKRMIKGNL